MPGGKPATLGRHHIKGQHAVRQAAGVGQRHLLASAQQVGKTQAAVNADQRRTARADHQPADLAGHSKQVASLDEHRPHQRIGAGLDGQPGDLGPAGIDQVRRQADAGLDLQWLRMAALDARGAHHRAAGLVAAHQHHRAGLAVDHIGPGQRSGLCGRHVGQVVAVGLGAQGAGLLQVPLAAGDLDGKAQGGGAHAMVLLRFAGHQSGAGAALQASAPARPVTTVEKNLNRL